ncbi:hypothetical protein RhiirA4_413882 [Rhizophagus irregularis]|uniref:Uncharacterized protein n=1 Tax=Rhizophagus irregularis TaxID=588596 RepID=A0A2I1FUL4_9GLOM|nr:hypothetical protein RhiirA4_413882 [Rhizophagus irregularis]
MALRVVSEYFTKMKKFQKMQAYIIYMQFICCIACLVQDALFFAELREIEDVIDRSKIAIGFFSCIYYIFVDIFCIIFNGNSAILIARNQNKKHEKHRKLIKWDYIIFIFEAILWIIYVIMKLLTWNGTTVAVLYFLGLLGPGGIMHYLGTVIFGIVNLFLYIICYTLNGTSWTNEIIE